MEIRVSFQTFTKLMMTQPQVNTTKDKAMTAQYNQGVGSQVNPMHVLLLLESKISQGLILLLFMALRWMRIHKDLLMRCLGW